MSEYPVPVGVPSAVTLPELRLLQRYAHKARTVLEIGTHYGFTCIGMALAGAHVTSVDPHFEGPADAPDTWEPFLANVARHHLEFAIVGPDSPPPAWFEPPSRPVINAIRSAIEDVPDPLRPTWPTFGLVFIDGNHVWPCPQRDAEIAQAHLTEPGYIAFHDVTPRWPGVWRAAHEMEAGGFRFVEQVGTLAVYQK